MRLNRLGQSHLAQVMAEVSRTSLACSGSNIAAPAEGDDGDALGCGQQAITRQRSNNQLTLSHSSFSCAHRTRCRLLFESAVASISATSCNCSARAEPWWPPRGALPRPAADAAHPQNRTGGGAKPGASHAMTGPDVERSHTTELRGRV